MTAEQAAAYLGIATATVYANRRDSAKNGWPEPAQMVGRTPLWTAEQLDEWRKKHPPRRRKKVDTNPEPTEGSQTDA